MLAPGRADQPVQRVVGVVAAGLDLLIVEVDVLLRVVADRGDIPHRIVGIREVLQGLAAAPGHEALEAERPLVVGVRRRGAAAVRDRQPLPPGVVVEILDVGRARRGAPERDLDRLELPRLVVARVQHAPVGGDELDRTVQRVVGRRARVRRRLQRHGRRPVEDRLVLHGEPATRAQQVALEVVGVGRHHPRAVGDGVELAAQVRRLGGRARFAVDLLHHEPLGRPAVVEVGRGRPAQRIVRGPQPEAAAVPGVERLAGDVLQLQRSPASMLDRWSCVPSVS